MPDQKSSNKNAAGTVPLGFASDDDRSEFCEMGADNMQGGTTGELAFVCGNDRKGVNVAAGIDIGTGKKRAVVQRLPTSW